MNEIIVESWPSLLDHFDARGTKGIRAGFHDGKVALVAGEAASFGSAALERLGSQCKARTAAVMEPADTPEMCGACSRAP